MKKKIASIALAISLLFNSAPNANACMPTGALTADILLKMCHTCVFPLMVAGIPVVNGAMHDPYPASYAPLCTCLDPLPRIGIPVGFFEPSRIIEVVSDPFCFPTLGFGVPSGTTAGTLGGTNSHSGSSSKATFMQVHEFIFPIYAMAEIILDILCLQFTLTDIAYMTEVDPLWNSDTLGAFIAPEALLFGNPITNTACIADSVTSIAWTPLDMLFWCMGSWGNAYPMTGSKDSGTSYVQDTAGIASKFLYKMHRQLLAWGTWGTQGLCGVYPMPIWRKSAYRLQLLAPIPHIMGMTIGNTGLAWDMLKDVPMTFDNFGYLLFKKRDCCVL